METKVCKVCGRELPLSDFQKRYLSVDGYANTCKGCVGRNISEGRKNKFSSLSRKKGGNPDLAGFTPRELIEELKARGYKGTLKIEREIIL